jgi:hypothetical protein
VPARNTPRGRARSRKRRARTQAAAAGSTSSSAAASGVGEAAAPARAARPVVRERKRTAHKESDLYSPRGVGERPQAPWHPVPVSELLILVGAIGAAIGFSRGGSSGAAPMFAGLAAVLVGTLEFTLREHLSGYRSHTIIIAILAVATFHSAVALTVAAFTHVPRALTIALIALDIAVFAVMFKFMRARFLDARRERVFAGMR